MSGFNNPIIGGGGALVYPSIHSPNFVLSPLTGWSIQKNGSAYFASLTIGGAVVTVLIYSGVPAAGNLIASIAPVGGTDFFGNVYLAGETSYGELGGSFFATQNTQGQINFLTAATEAGPWTFKGTILIGNNGLVVDTAWMVQGALTVTPLLGDPGVVMLLPSGSGAAIDTLNLTTAISNGLTPVMLPGSWDLNCSDPTLTGLGAGQYIIGCGDRNTIINAHGSGDLFYWSAPSPGGDLLVTGGGFIGGATIDGAACSGAAVGIRAGDINALRFDCRCQNFNQTGGSWGFLFDNQNTFTERMQINIRARSCGFAGGDGGSVGFNVGGASTSTGSFARVKGRIEITTATNQRDGLVLTNGAHIYDCDLELVGNFSGGASATTAAALRITGTVPAGHPGAGTASSITNGRFEVGVECGTGAHTPTTFIQGTSSNGVRDCYGNANWNNNFTSSGITGPGWRYDGQVQGDASLGTRRAYGTAPTQTITVNGQTITNEVPSAKIPLSATASFTGLILAAGDEDGQVVWLVNLSSHNQTFDVAGTSNVANGASAIIGALEAMQLIWDAGSALWYQVQ